jgi:hypothetical protein
MKEYCAYGLESAIGSSLAQPMGRLGLAAHTQNRGAPWRWVAAATAAL